MPRCQTGRVPRFAFAAYRPYQSGQTWAKHRMAQDNSLEGLRREVDEIDDALLDLLTRRAKTTAAIARTKPSADGRIPLASAMRPAREAQIMRRLAARHGEQPPLATVIAVMREILSSSLMAQVPFRLHVFAAAPGLTELAQAHFGAQAPVTRHENLTRMLNACAEDTDSIAIVPVPEAGGDAWWTRLAPAGAGGPRVIAKLPFIARDDIPVSAYVVAAIEQEATGDDTTLLIANVSPSLSRGGLITQLKNAGLTVRPVANTAADKRDYAPLLVEAEGYVAAGDPRLAEFCGAVGTDVAAIFPVGGFANPLRERVKEPA